MIKKSKICHIVFCFHCSGIESFILDLVQEQVKFFDVHIMILNNDITNSDLYLLPKGIKIIEIGRRINSKSLIPFIKMNFLLFKYKYDVIHLHRSKLIKALFFPINRIILTVHDFNQKIYRVNKIDSIVPVSQAVCNNLDVSEIYKNKVKVIRNGINFNNFVKKKQFNVKKIKIIQVSRLVIEEKGQDILLKSVAELVNIYNFDIELTFIGAGISLPYLQSLASELGIEDCIIWLGNKPKSYICNCLHEYDILVQPSRFEPFGIVPLEALATNIPLIVSNIDGINEVISSELGFMFDIKKDNLTQVILNVINTINKNLITDFVRNAYNYSYKIFNINFVSEEYINESYKIS